MGIVNNATKAAFENDAKEVIEGISYLQLKGYNYNVSDINETNLNDLTGLSADNYKTLLVTEVNKKINVTIIGKNAWEGLIACGTDANVKVENSRESICPISIDDSGASGPELASNMIPVMYYNGNWVKADKINSNETYSWYDYRTKKWANAVTVTSVTLDMYKKATIGTPVDEEDILTYLVWVPRFKYAISSLPGTRSIDIVFENSSTTKSNGTAIDTSYLTHPAFTFGKELNGLWVGKFEITGEIDAITITIKPNLKSLGFKKVSEFYTIIRNMNSSGNIYNFSGNEADTHMIKNDEWGAATYLSRSIYGLNSEIYKNNSSGYYTGRSGGNVGGSQIKLNSDGGEVLEEYTSKGFYKYDGKCATTNAFVETQAADGTIDENCDAEDKMLKNPSLAYNASTTGNIYGIYDMSGGKSEYVMANYNNYSGQKINLNSGFNGPNGGDSTIVTTGIDFPLSQYYNLYTTEGLTTACNGGI